MEAHALDTRRVQNYEIASTILDLVVAHSHIPNSLAYLDPQFPKVLRLVEQKERIHFILPAFPAKSPNREKTLGPLPDLGEYLALKRLAQLCEQIGEIYQPGAEITICSDGLVFSDLVGVSDADVQTYRQKIDNLIAKHFPQLNTFHLDSVFTGELIEVRSLLEKKYGEPIEQLRERSKIDFAEKYLIDGIHRFLFEDYASQQPRVSREKIRKATRPLAYQVVQRSHAWSELIQKHFPTAVRLSIHPQFQRTHKLGIQLLASDSKWATPWHRVTLYNGVSCKLVKYKDALAAGAVFYQTTDGLSYMSTAGKLREENL